MRMKKTLLAAAAAATIGIAGFAGAAPANAVECVPALMINGPTTNAAANWYYGTTGTLLDTVALSSPDMAYGDVALSADGLTVYGVKNGSSDDDVIDVLDAKTGAVTGHVTISSGPAVGIGQWYGAAMRPDGKLLIGGNQSKIFTIDLATGASAEFYDFMSLSYPGLVSATTTGDFATLPNGDEIALATLADGSTTVDSMVRINSSGNGIVVGEVPEAYGAGRVGDDIELAQADGKITKIAIADIPTSSSTSLLTFTLIVDVAAEAGNFWGAAGTHDTGEQNCPPALPDTGMSDAQKVSAGLLALGLGLAGAAGIMVARRRRA